jgi:dipeptidyl aminopeptidase/acylaminoacyl peptidase
MERSMTTSTNGSKPTFRQYTAIRRYQPALAFSPDGDHVAYSVNISGQYNLWRQPADGGYPVQLTLSASQSVRDIRWSPDGTEIAYTADNDGDEFTRVYRIPARGGEPVEAAGEAEVRYFLGEWSPDGTTLAYAANDREPADQDVLLLDRETGEAKRVVDYGGIYYAGQWSPDGTRMVVADVKSNTDLDLYVLDLESEELVHATPHEGEVYNYPVGWAADGSGFYVLTDEDHEFTGLAFHRLEDNTREWVEPPEWNIEDVVVSKDGARLVWAVNEDGYSRLHVRDLQGEDETRSIDLPDGVLSTMTISSAGDKLAVLWQTATHPSEVYIVELGTGEARQITQGALGGLTDDDLTSPELIRYPSFDREIPAFIYRPEGVEGRMPVVLSIHGGPEAQERPQYMYTGFYQYLTSRGIGIMATNIRGSSGYGKSYQRLIHRDWGGDELKDLEHAVLWLREQDWVDPDRIAVYGGSFGGFATLSCVSRLPDYWACAVDLVGPSNLVTFAKAVPPTWKRMMAKWVGDPETEADFLMERSPITYVDQITAPLFVIQGANDPRVVKPESDQIVERLRERGVEVRYDVYEDEGHGFTKRENELKAFRDMADFLEGYLLS